MTNKHYDVAIIGAGPGGYVAAIRAGQLGLKTCLIEKTSVGGVCLNWGCIPSKNLLHQASILEDAKSLEAFGATLDTRQLDYAKVQNNSRDVVNTLTGGVQYLLKKSKVDLVYATAKLDGPNRIALDNGKAIDYKHAILATGSRPTTITGFEFDKKQVLSSTDILRMTHLPKKLVILGGGAIGCEFAYVMNTFGVDVTLVEMADQLLPNEDMEITAALEKSFANKGINLKTSAKATGIKKRKGGATVTIELSDGKTEYLEADIVLAVFGREPNTEKLGLESVGIQTDTRGYIITGDFCKTSTANVFAIGDITQTSALAHVASKEGELAVEYIAGHPSYNSRIDPLTIPSAIYCEPQVAGFGWREQDAKAQGIDYKTFSFPLSAIGKAIATHKTEGLVKTLIDRKTGEIIGGHIIGYNATELIHQILQAKCGELLTEDIGSMIHAHPTFSEAIMEQMRGLYSQPIHA
jgi:dihydrolipoamide dehydrogenase